MMTRPGRITSSMEPINDFICFLIVIIVIVILHNIVIVIFLLIVARLHKLGGFLGS